MSEDRPAYTEQSEEDRSPEEVQALREASRMLAEVRPKLNAGENEQVVRNMLSHMGGVLEHAKLVKFEEGETYRFHLVENNGDKIQAMEFSPAGLIEWGIGRRLGKGEEWSLRVLELTEESEKDQWGIHLEDGVARPNPKGTEFNPTTAAWYGSEKIYWFDKDGITTPLRDEEGVGSTRISVAIDKLPLQDFLPQPRM